MFKRRSKNKKVRNATTNTYKGIKFRSKLERFTYQYLTSRKVPFDYENVRFTIIDGFKYEGDCIEKKVSKGKNVFFKVSNRISKATYLPDFVNLDQGWIIECKGVRTEAFNLRWKMFKRSLVKQKKIYDLYMPGTQKQVIEAVEMIIKKNKDVKRNIK
jgi:hypothetical protein|tara:strand:- start:4976 stop:5449 length:474 start_codon:yes stop_codon:yes gene_type:complete